MPTGPSRPLPTLPRCAYYTAPRLRIYLYHIPPVAGVGISMSLIERLLKAYPKTVAGIKDSGEKGKG